MKYLVVIGLLMVGIQIGASQLSTNSRSTSKMILDSWQKDGHTSMKESIGKLGNNFNTESYQQLVAELEKKNNFFKKIREQYAQEIDKDETLNAGFKKTFQDFDDLKKQLKKQLEASVLVDELEVECKEMTAVVSSEEEASISEDSYKNALRAAKECLDFLNSKKALLPDDKFKEFKDQLEGFKAKIERSGERHGFKEIATPQPEPLIQEDTCALVDAQPTTSIATQEQQTTTSFDSSAATTTTQTPPQPTLERSVSIPTVPAGKTVVPIPAKPKYNWKALFGIGAGVVTVAATVIWYLWSPKNIIISHS